MLGLGTHPLTIGPCDELDMDGKEKKKKTENKDDSCISGSPKWMVGGVMP